MNDKLIRQLKGMNLSVIGLPNAIIQEIVDYGIQEDELVYACQQIGIYYENSNLSPTFQLTPLRLAINTFTIVRCYSFECPCLVYYILTNTQAIQLIQYRMNTQPTIHTSIRNDRQRLAK